MPGYSINDVLQTDYDTLIGVLDASTAKKPNGKTEPIPLADFVKSL
ncbi:hypothetical protein [Schleiferilactobacillus harbinensis]|nr:hypothetical protein [Schleiferilactobacillus harbinensis]